MGSTKNVDMSMTDTEIKIVGELNADQAVTEISDADDDGQVQTTKPQKVAKTHSKKYQAVRAQVDKTRQYDPFSAIELVKRLSYSAFPGTITAHAELREKEQGAQVTIQFPHSTGKTVRVEIADEKTLEKIGAGAIDFDILLSTPAMMSKLTKFAPILGPQGLMPNPKQGTLTQQPEEKKKELESGKLTLRAERKAPLMHVVIGNTEMDTKEIQENLETLTKSLKNKLTKLSIAATMSPGIKVEVETE